AELVGDLAVVLRARVLVLDLQRDRRPGRPALEDSREDAHRVALAALGGEARLAGLAPVEPGLDVGLGELDQGRHAVAHAADRRPVALAPGRDAEQEAEGVVRHGGTGNGPDPSPASR